MLHFSAIYIVLGGAILKAIRFLLASITIMILALIGLIGGGQGLILTYILVPVSLVLMFVGLCIDDHKQVKEQKNKDSKLGLYIDNQNQVKRVKEDKERDSKL